MKLFPTIGWDGMTDSAQFQHIQKLVFNRTFSREEKGMKRHGKGRPLPEQPAFLVRINNPGFFTGQAMKKIIEANEWEGDEADGVSEKHVMQHQIEEFTDAIVYLQFEILHRMNELDKLMKAEASLFGKEVMFNEEEGEAEDEGSKE